MHTTRLKAAWWNTAVLIHNGDWSGRVLLRAWQSKNPDKGNFRPDVDIAIEEDRSVKIVSGEEFPTATLMALVFVAGQDMGVARLSDAITDVTERFS